MRKCANCDCWFRKKEVDLHVCPRGRKIVAMEGSGANSNIIPAVNPQGDKIKVPVLATTDKVEIGGWLFERADLLLAMGVNTHSNEVAILRRMVEDRDIEIANCHRELSKVKPW